MSRSNRVPVYLTDEEKQQLVSHAQSVNESQSDVVRTALMEYLDRDKVTRIEDKVDRLLASIEGPPTESDEERTHTHTSSGGSGGTSKTVQRAEEIAERVTDSHGAVVKAGDVEFAIEDVAGGDPRTMKKYKKTLRKRGLLYSHPNNPVWTSEADRWAKWSVSYVDNKPSADMVDICDGYPHSPDGQLFSKHETTEAKTTAEA